MILFKKLGPEVKDRLVKLGEYFEKRHDISVVYLFGTLALGEVRPLSDIDIVVLLRDKDNHQNEFKLKLELLSELTNLLGTEEIDLVILNRCPISLAYHAISEHCILFERDAQKRINFETKIIDSYLDFSSFRKIQQKYLLEQLKEGTYFE